MSRMRIVARRAAALVAIVVLSSSLLTGCTSGTLLYGDARAPATEVAATTPPADAPTPTPTPPEPASTLPHTVGPQPGDCPVDSSDAGHIVTFVVTTDDDTTPIEITYPGFTPSVSGQPRTITAVGPVITILGSDCGPGVATEPWQLTATGEVQSFVSCAAFFGGMLFNTGSGYSESADTGASADCTGRPGM